MICGTLLQTLILLYIVYKTNWNKEVRTSSILLLEYLLQIYGLSSYYFSTLFYFTTEIKFSRLNKHPNGCGSGELGKTEDLTLIQHNTCSSRKILT